MPRVITEHRDHPTVTEVGYAELSLRDLVDLARGGDRGAVDHLNAHGPRSVVAAGDWDESKHPRGQPGNRGQFGPGDGGTASEHARDEMLRALREPDGGFTIDPRSGEGIHTGFAVAVGEHTSRTPADQFFAGPPGEEYGRQVIKDWLRDEADYFAAHPEANVGGWHDPSTGHIVLDPSLIIADRDEAIAAGIANDQQAITDLAAVHEGRWDDAFINTGGTGGVGPPELAVPTTLDGVSDQLRATISDRYSDGAAPDVLSPSWRNGAAWDQILTPQAKELADPKAANPDRYEANKVSGFEFLKAGETESRIAFRSDDGSQPPRVFDVTPAPKGMNIEDALATGRLVRTGSLLDPLLVVPGSERPPDSVYRVMATGEYDQAKTRGYIQTDAHMNLGAEEGTVASLRSTGSFYVPTPRDGAGDYRIARIDYRDEDGWRLDTDEYVKTDKPVPFDRISAVTEPLPNPRADEPKP